MSSARPSTTNPRVPRAFDPQVFAELTLGRPALQLELLDLFLSQGREARARLGGLAVQGAEAFKAAIHALLGSARIVAAVHLCSVIDRSYAEGGWDRLDWREQIAEAVSGAFDALEPVLIAFAEDLRRRG